MYYAYIYIHRISQKSLITLKDSCYFMSWLMHFKGDLRSWRHLYCPPNCPESLQTICIWEKKHQISIHQHPWALSICFKKPISFTSSFFSATKMTYIYIYIYTNTVNQLRTGGLTHLPNKKKPSKQKKTASIHGGQPLFCFPSWGLRQPGTRSTKRRFWYLQ